MPKARLFACVFAFWLTVGCGPLQRPLPLRLDDEGQKAVDEAWDKVMARVDRFDNQTLLDILIVTQAYQTGVDKLEYRSEKRFSGGMVVMEIRYDRSAPKEDRFEVKVVDGEGKVIRRERYEREQIEKTDEELVRKPVYLRAKKEKGIASPDDLKKLEALEARLAGIGAVFPKPKEEEKAKE